MTAHQHQQNLAVNHGFPMPEYESAPGPTVHEVSPKIDPDLLQSIRDAHALLVRTRKETGMIHDSEVILAYALEKYGALPAQSPNGQVVAEGAD